MVQFVSSGFCVIRYLKHSKSIPWESDYIIGLVTPAISQNKSKKRARLIAAVHNIRGKVWKKNGIHGFTVNNLLSVGVDTFKSTITKVGSQDIKVGVFSIDEYLTSQVFSSVENIVATFAVVLSSVDSIIAHYI